MLQRKADISSETNLQRFWPLDFRYQSSPEKVMSTINFAIIIHCGRNFYLLSQYVLKADVKYTGSVCQKNTDFFYSSNLFIRSNNQSEKYKLTVILSFFVYFLSLKQQSKLNRSKQTANFVRKKLGFVDSLTADLECGVWSVEQVLDLFPKTFYLNICLGIYYFYIVHTILLFSGKISATFTGRMATITPSFGRDCQNFFGENQTFKITKRNHQEIFGSLWTFAHGCKRRK